MKSGRSWESEVLSTYTKSLHEHFSAKEDKEADMFLNPADIPKGEKVLRIVDFLATLVPTDDERTISDNGISRLVISYDQRKPRLESVTLSQWVVADTRIFSTLLFAGKLPTARDVKDYLAYTVKVMELGSRYVWESVLKYDDEFRQLQAAYGYPWSYDSHHLLGVTLVSKQAAKSKPVQPNNISSSSVSGFISKFNAQGKEICRNFNRPKGCSLPSCLFSRECNRRVNGRPCGSPHAAFQHQHFVAGPTQFHPSQGGGGSVSAHK